MLAAFLAGELEGYDCGCCEEILRIERGCVQQASRAHFVFEDGTELSRCPARSVTPELVHVARAYRFREAGHLPVAGGWLEQSATLLSAFEILDAEIASYEKKP